MLWLESRSIPTLSGIISGDAISNRDRSVWITADRNASRGACVVVEERVGESSHPMTNRDIGSSGRCDGSQPMGCE